MTSHAENFSLDHYLSHAKGPFDDRFNAFRPFVDRVQSMGFVLREITGPAGPVVGVLDEVTGDSRDVIMLGSNNYLGLATEPEITEAAVRAIRQYGIGCGGPPLLNGTTSLHRELEARLADFKHCESAMLFSSGYSANLGWMTGLLRAGDVLVFDSQSHASIVDGVQLGRIKSIPFAHNDVDDLRSRLMQLRRGNPDANVVVAIEGVYSMDGDIAPLSAIKQACDEFGAWLALDDAHGTGVLGAHGGGSAQHFGLDGRVQLTMGTFSKVFGCTGGFVAGSRDLIDTLRFFSRSYMFSASLPIPVVAAVLAGLDFLRANPGRLLQLRSNVTYLADALRNKGFDVNPQAAIMPIAVPADVSVAEAVAALYRAGVFVNGVEYPAVPRDGGRLRLSVMATMTREHLDKCIDALEIVAHRLGFHPQRLNHAGPES